VASKELPSVDPQGELVLARRAEPNEVPAEMIRRQDKEIYGALGIDAGYFSRIKKGEASLQADLVAPFCELVANRIYPEWMAYRIGCTLVQIKSEAERRAELAEQRAAEAEKKLAYAESLLRKVAA
jgi:hypothetical protein